MAEQLGEDHYEEVMSSLEGIIEAVEDVMNSITEATTWDDLMEAMTHVEEALKNGRVDVATDHEG